jgi:uncharacterized protein
MKNQIRKNIVFLLISVIVLTSMVGCGAPSNQPQKVAIKVATGNTGGVYYPVGVAIGQLFSDKIENVISSAMSTGGSVDNIGLLASGEAQVATMMETVVEDAYNGVGVFEGKKDDSIRAITSLWPNLNHIVVHKDIKSFEDLKGEKFVVGASRSGTETDSYAIFSTMGIFYRDEDGDKKNMEPVWVAYAEAVEQMKNKQVAGGLFNAFPPGSSITDLLSTGDFHILSFTNEQIEKLSAEYPLYSKYTIASGTYPNQTEDVTLVGYPNLLLTNTAQSEEVVYNLTKTIFENLDFLVDAHSAAKLIKLETAQDGINIPFHDGAIKYFKEKGVYGK